MGLFEIESQSIPQTLQEKFLAPPLSILDSRQGYWQKRKIYYNDLFKLKTNIGRDLHLQGDIKSRAYFKNGFGEGAVNTSMFDPVLCELVYKWFSNENDKILDVFAGGVVRGLVASILNRQYVGIDLSETQLLVNAHQYNKLSKIYKGMVEPVWVNGDSLKCKELVNDKYNLLFTCPPYYNLEIYSDSPNDLSNMKSYEEFITTYSQIIKNACDMLEENSFAVIVVGDIRDKNGFYYDFISDTKKAFINANCKLYNELILIEQIGNAAIRAGRHFNISRKITKIHQNVLVFYKGDIKCIKEKFGNFNL